ncbi:MAG: methyltransferase domain-containing protein, partial [Elusimicrobiales bacterium]|nr:methyltransferase domain-containing protein [Elusimicrobiales bacterium]
MRKAITHCRACGAPLIKNPLLSMAGMPKGAQFLPSRAQLKLERGVNLYIRQCSGCGLVQLDSTPVPYWREVIRAAAFSPEMGEFRKKQFSAFVKKYKLRGKKVLEPGCGKGEYLRLMAAAGARAYGLEYCAASVQEARRAGLKVTRGFVTGGGITGGSFDAFFTMNFLEHLPEPNVFLSGIAANLSPGGVGLVEVPNFDMVIRKKLFSEFIPDHLFYFTSDTLRSLLERNGFQVLSMKSVWHDYILSVEIRKRTSLDLKAFK